MLTQRFFETTRGRIVALLRRGVLTIDDLASELTLSANAVRVQVTAMERDGLVQRVGQRSGATRPSHVFGLTPEIEQLLSRAYLPLISQFVHVVTTALPAGKVESLMREAGRALARELTSGRRPSGSLVARVKAASDLMNQELGAVTHVEQNGKYVIRGMSCPLR